MEKENTTITYLCGCCLCLSIIVLAAGCISYVVFGIIFLVDDYDITHECDNSSLWAYVLVAVIMSLCRLNAKNKNEDSSDNDLFKTLCSLVCIGLIDLGLGIWGGFELWVKPCNNLYDTQIWKFGLATFIMQITFAVCFSIVVPVGICCKLINKKEVENNKDNRELDYTINKLQNTLNEIKNKEVIV